MKTKILVAVLLLVGSSLLTGGLALSRQQKTEVTKPVQTSSAPSSKMFIAFEKFWETNEYNLDEDQKPLRLVEPIDFFDLKSKCGKWELFALSMNGVHANNSKGETVNVGGLWTGSGGTLIFILGWDPKAETLTKLYADNLVDLESSLPSDAGACPNIPVFVHGSEFGKIGYDYVKTNLIFDTQKKKYFMNKGK